MPGGASLCDGIGEVGQLRHEHRGDVVGLGRRSDDRRLAIGRHCGAADLDFELHEVVAAKRNGARAADDPHIVEEVRGRLRDRKLCDAPLAELELNCRGVVNAGVWSMGNGGPHAGGLFSDEPQREVDQVAADVEERSATRISPRRPSRCSSRGRPIEPVIADQVADRTLRNQVVDPMRHAVTERVAHHAGHACAGGRELNLFGLRLVHRHRLLDEQVFAGSDRRERQGCKLVVRRCDQHRIDISCLEQVANDS